MNLQCSQSLLEAFSVNAVKQGDWFPLFLLVIYLLFKPREKLRKPQFELMVLSVIQKHYYTS